MISTTRKEKPAHRSFFIIKNNMSQLKSLTINTLWKRTILYLSFFLIHTSLFAQDSIATLNFLFVGDIMGHEPQIRTARQADNTYNYKPCFEYVKPTIEAADFAVGNLEVTLPGEEPYEGFPLFKSPDALATALKDTGFDLLVTANNHVNDARAEGVINTIKVLEEHGFYQTGSFKDTISKALYYPLIVYRGGFKLAFLNYTYATNGIPTRKPTLVNEIDDGLMEGDLAAAKALDPDFIIVIMHWGTEGHLVENKEQRKLARQIYDWGADMIIGAHPHVVQPIKEETLVQADSSLKKVVTAYSLGNFISNQKSVYTDGGVMFELTLEKNLSTGKTNISKHHYIPIWRYIQRDKQGKATFLTVPITVFEQDKNNTLGLTEKDKKEMKAYAKMIRRLMKRDGNIEFPVPWDFSTKK